MKTSYLFGLLAIVLASGQAMADSKAPIRMTDAQMDKIVAGSVECSGNGQDATCTGIDTAPISQPFHGPLVLEGTETTTTSYAGPSCSSGNINTGNCPITNVTITDAWIGYFNTSAGKFIGKPVP